uniref:SAM-dependent MTase RsmB/NOP-type domain-containing protein n=1 Tax=Denticeps clupeoides TaxID=299321 RepID=A0AAY4EDT6_9TELE
MVKQDHPRRNPSRTQKKCSQMSSFKDLNLQERSGSDHSPPAETSLSPPGDLQEHQRGFASKVYLHAAAVFQNYHPEKPVAIRLISYGKKMTRPVPDASDDASRRCAYELAFNTLKYQDLLEDIMIDSCLFLTQPMPDDMMSLVAVMLYDFQDRKFLPRELLSSEPEEEEVPEVREVEEHLLRSKTRLAASLARCRIKHNLVTIDTILPDSVREMQVRASCQPIYAWVNTLKTSLAEVCDLLKTEGFSQVTSVGRLERRSFCHDRNCQDLLVFTPQQKAELSRTKLLSQYKLLIQDKSCCLGPCAVRPLLVPEGDVLMAGSFSALTVAHVAAIAASLPPLPQDSGAQTPSQVLVCGGEQQAARGKEMQETLNNVGCRNVKLIPEDFISLDVCDVRVQKVHLVLLMPQCSVSAVCNPVEYLLQENGDIDLLRDLSQGSISRGILDSLVSQQKNLVNHALRFPKVQAVVYSTCSVYPDENEELLTAALAQAREQESKLRPFRLSGTELLHSHVADEGETQTDGRFFRLEPSADSNGCFVAVLTREPEAIETPQEVLARAAAKGLLDGIYPSQPAKKDRRGRQRHQAPRCASQPRPRASRGNQSDVREFQASQMKDSSSKPLVGSYRSQGSVPSGDASSLHFSPSVTRSKDPRRCRDLLGDSSQTSPPDRAAQSDVLPCG